MVFCCRPKSYPPLTEDETETPTDTKTPTYSRKDNTDRKINKRTMSILLGLLILGIFAAVGAVIFVGVYFTRSGLYILL